MIIANRPGAGGLIGAQAAMPADGYTILLANPATPFWDLEQNLPFDPVGDFSGICLIGDAKPRERRSFPRRRSLRAFIDLAKTKPGGTHGSAGIGPSS